MENIVLKCCLIIVLFPNFIYAGCSFMEPFDNFDRVKSGMAWFSAKNIFAIRRYANGAESNSTCQKFTIRTPASETKTIYYADGSTSNLTVSVLPASSTCNPARVELTVPPGIPAIYYITYTDYEELWFIRACYNDEDHLWIFSSELHPCKKIERIIDDVIKKQHLDRQPIFRMDKCAV